MLPTILRCYRSAHPIYSSPVARLASHMDTARPVEGAITSKLTDAFHPEHLEVHNESHMHAVPPGSESHFRVLVVSGRFQGLSLLQRHRLVNEALKVELNAHIHALAIQAKTPEQWRGDPSLAQSPPCLGGSRGDRSVEDKLKAGH